MGRSIPSISHRLDSRIRQWERYSKLLGRAERKAFLDLIATVRNQREAIAAADEADLGIAIVLAMAVANRRRLDEQGNERDSGT